ncbi:MAG: sugar ABC transporter ATP-binding protein [Solirubrobacterales bacterium]|nr:sugar ABC transporter ATP-binding protein [Solirubrobacterales bacterium]
MATEASLLEMRGVEKSFPGVRALGGVDLTLPRGHVLGIVGENGAGKSTLVKILAGAYDADAGTTLVDGEQLAPGPGAALQAGVAVIYQELSLVPEMSVAENMYLGHMGTRMGFLDRRGARREARQLLSRVGLEQLDPAAPVSSLSLATRQLVEVGKALARRARILVMDEPTSSLQHDGIEKLFAVVRSLRDEGIGIIYISHHLDEVFALCDSATVLRDGVVVETRPIADWDETSLVRAMVNRDLASMYPWRPRELGETLLEVRDLEAPPRVRGVSFSVRRGEILGIAGIDGAGRTELLKALAGIDPAASGTVLVSGEERRLRSVGQGLGAGIAYVPEDRKLEGLVLGAAIEENVALSSYGPLARFGFVNRRTKRSMAERAMKRFGVRAASPRQEAGELSGGNQQKVILGRVSELHPEVVLLDEPTRGIDVGAKTEIYSYILQLAEQGAGIVLVSSELPEVLGMADRVLVLRFGRIAAELMRDEADQEKILQYATAG